MTLAVASETLAAHVRRLAGTRLAACRLVELSLASTVTRTVAGTLDACTRTPYFVSFWNFRSRSGHATVASRPGG